jgi:hypothetical protein
MLGGVERTSQEDTSLEHGLRGVHAPGDVGGGAGDGATSSRWAAAGPRGGQGRVGPAVWARISSRPCSMARL